MVSCIGEGRSPACGYIGVVLVGRVAQLYLPGHPARGDGHHRGVVIIVRGARVVILSDAKDLGLRAP
jgi:hypothetical protein